MIASITHINTKISLNRVREVVQFPKRSTVLGGYTGGDWSVSRKGTQFAICSTATGKGYYSSIATVFERPAHPLNGGAVTHQEREANAVLMANAKTMFHQLIKITQEHTLEDAKDRAKFCLEEIENMRAKK